MLPGKIIPADKLLVSRNDKKYMCCICDWFILKPPVFLHPFRGFICGFCYQDRRHFLKDEDLLLPQPLYAAIAIYLRFPCEFCDLYTMFNDPAITHELQCSKRIFACPLSNVNKWFLKEGEQCDWQDNDGKSMVVHVKKHHKENLLSNPYQIRFGDIMNSNYKKHVNIAILNNRKIISITTENVEEDKCIIFKCRSNIYGNPGTNYGCRIEFITLDTMTQQVHIPVFPLGAKIEEEPSDYCVFSIDGLEDDMVFRFTFSPPLYEKNQSLDPNNDEVEDEDYEFQC